MMPGIITKAGKVILLNVPKTSKNAKTKLEAREAFCKRVSHWSLNRVARLPYFFFRDALDKHKTPKYYESLDGV